MASDCTTAERNTARARGGTYPDGFVVLLAPILARLLVVALHEPAHAPVGGLVHVPLVRPREVFGGHEGAPVGVERARGVALVLARCGPRPARVAEARHLGRGWAAVRLVLVRQPREQVAVDRVEALQVGA